MYALNIKKEEIKKEEIKKPDEKLLSDNYIILKQIGSGSFGEVYIAQHKTGGFVAAKVEERTRVPRIYNEYRIYRYLDQSGFKQGLPGIYDFIQTPDYNIMFMQLLGPNLEDLFNECGRRFKLPTVLLLAEQLISLLQQLHTAHFIHRDIKPNNFLIGRNNRNQLYIMDFGLSKKYIVNDKHIPYRDKRSLIGTARYASLNMQMSIEPTRRDDLESTGYMLIYFLKGSLPWQGLKKKKDAPNNIERIGEVKMCTSIDTLCADIPECFKTYLAECRKLQFDENPNYDYLKSLFTNYATKENITPSYEWLINVP